MSLAIRLRYEGIAKQPDIPLGVTPGIHQGYRPLSRTHSFLSKTTGCLLGTSPALQQSTPYHQKKRGGRPKKQRHILKELEELGVTRPFVAQKLLEVFQDGDAKEKLTASRMYLALTGDIRDERSGAGTVINTGPTMVIVGASAKRMEALRGAIPQMSMEQAEEERAARTNERLAELRAGKAITLKHSKNEFARENEQVEVSSLESGADRPDTKAEPPAG